MAPPYLFVGDQYINKRIHKRDPADLSYVDIKDPSPKSPIGVSCDETHFYFWDSVSGHLNKYLISDMSFVQSESAGFGFSVLATFSSDTYVFLGRQDGIVERRLKSDFSYVDSCDVGGLGFINSVYGGCAPGDGYIYLAIAGDDERIQKRVESTLVFVDETNGVPGDLLDFPYGIASYGGYLYVCETLNYRISKFLASDLSFVNKIGSFGSGNDQFNDPRGIAADGAYLYVADYGNYRIQKRLTSDLSYVTKIGSVGSGNDQFNLPESIAIQSIPPPPPRSNTMGQIIW